ncbi:MAG: penicillin-binding protein [Saprospiraceae bacterium]|nr:MAG: penicillin-binding protein [Saprospiraceae bacterium]
MDVKNEVLYRVYFLVFALVVPISMLLFYKTVQISIIDGDKWREDGKKAYIRERPIEAERGNIMAADGSLLATSVPYFDIFFDPFASSEDDYYKNLDTLAYCLATFVDDSYTVGGYREYLYDLRDTLINRKRHIPIKRKVSYSEKREIEKFPLFNLGQYRGGFIAVKRSERKRPFGVLARRTIGYVREEAQDIGLEGTFDDILGGSPGSEFAMPVDMIQVDKSQDLWMPLEDLASIEPKSGDDILTTLDINIQDISERALMRAVRHHDAEWGTAIVMEVKTGKIRAIANLGKVEDREEWYEIYNYAIGTGIEPGSTFKLASIMALLEDGYITLEDSIDIENGRTTFYEDVMEDASPYSFKLDTITVRKAFEISSNVGIAKLVDKYYGTPSKINENKGAAKFIERLKGFNLNLPTDVKIQGEEMPFIKEAYSSEDQWSGITLPWMSTGYEMKLTPLQLLTFYNAVANNGVMMKPMLVEQVQRFGEPLEIYRPTVVKKELASKKTLEQAQQLLRGVVERGTAQKLYTERFSFAGKTGTAQVDYKRLASGTRVGGYQASFVGYFPAEDPLYSCTVVIYKPRRNGFYGGDVAGPVFKEIAEKCYESILELHEPINAGPRPMLGERSLPVGSIGYKEDMKQVLEFLNLSWYGDPETELTALTASADSLTLNRRTVSDETIPNVVGMGLRDALFLLENKGLKVDVEGVGKVIRQSHRPGTPLKGQTLILTLN